MDKTVISFPGLGIGEFTLNKVAFSLFDGFLTVRWYALFICTGILLAYLYFMWRGTKKEKILEDHLINIVLFVVPIGIIGARLLYVLTSGNQYNDIIQVFAVWEGGLAIYGGIIFGFLTVLGYSFVKKINFLKILDALAPAVLIGQILGRWGNFFNGEAFGASANVESIPWRMVVNGEVTHPTFFYESFWNFIGFIIANLLYKNKKFDGQIFSFYVAWYGIGRGFIEILRTDSLMIGNIKLMVVLGFCCFVAGVVTYILLYLKNKKTQDDIEEYKALKDQQSQDENEPKEEETANVGDNN